MTPDPTSRPANRAPRGLARFIAGLALAAVTAACGSSDDGATPGPTAAPTSAVTATPDVTEGSVDPTASPDATKTSRKPAPTQSGRIDGTYTLRIPRIGVHAPVVPIKSNEDRVLEPPRDTNIAGWWSDGAAPGEPRGSAVVVGHAVRNDGGGVFDDIGDLGRGDAIKVQGSGSTLNYRVKSVDVWSKDELARNAEEIFAQTGAGRLVVISCEDWDGTAWRSNVVTIAAPV